MGGMRPTVCEGTLVYEEGGEARAVGVGEAGWYAWLAGARAFAYRGPGGAYAAREAGGYWTGYRKWGGEDAAGVPGQGGGANAGAAGRGGGAVGRTGRVKGAGASGVSAGQGRGYRRRGRPHERGAGRRSQCISPPCGGGRRGGVAVGEWGGAARAGWAGTSPAIRGQGGRCGAVRASARAFAGGSSLGV